MESLCGVSWESWDQEISQGESHESRGWAIVESLSWKKRMPTLETKNREIFPSRVEGHIDSIKRWNGIS